MGFVDDGEVERDHGLSVQPLPARQSSLQRPTDLPQTQRVLRIVAVYQGGIRGENDHRPLARPQRQLDRVRGGPYAQLLQDVVFSNEYTATIGPL